MEAQANTTREQSNKKSIEVGDPRMAEMEEKEKKYLRVFYHRNKKRAWSLWRNTGIGSNFVMLTGRVVSLSVTKVSCCTYVSMIFD